jgi:hypothetical protein
MRLPIYALCALSGFVTRIVSLAIASGSATRKLFVQNPDKCFISDLEISTVRRPNFFVRNAREAEAYKFRRPPFSTLPFVPLSAHINRVQITLHWRRLRRRWHETRDGGHFAGSRGRSRSHRSPAMREFLRASKAETTAVNLAFIQAVSPVRVGIPRPAKLYGA